MSEFKREDRYIVIKRSDLEKIPNQKVVHKFLGALGGISAHSCRIPQRKFLVIESDWPEYGPAWAAIESRVAGSPIKAGQGEAVARIIEDNDGSQPRLARLVHPLPPAGTKLYTAPPATGVNVPRELLANFIEYSVVHEDGVEELWNADKQKLRALLAQAQS